MAYPRHLAYEHAFAAYFCAKLLVRSLLGSFDQLPNQFMPPHGRRIRRSPLWLDVCRLKKSNANELGNPVVFGARLRQICALSANTAFCHLRGQRHAGSEASTLTPACRPIKSGARGETWARTTHEQEATRVGRPGRSDLGEEAVRVARLQLGSHRRLFRGPQIDFHIRDSLAP